MGKTKDNIIPAILEPAAFAIWFKNTVQTVTWDTTGTPEQSFNPHATRILLWDVTQENILLEQPLASGFNIFSGRQLVTVPDVPSGLYQIVFVGGSGSLGQSFFIVE
ncbi:hypothetical protein DFP72DRAFT_1177198 [Ephemerocybe angulata]|uniref:Uncharacterized protein n=1 Tax=Ephemerocybe angulata TaxID=980116 RepID=A0A8H6HBW3_9AGAR|nr:hypothetical protein DFP72DRAFT_1177198 [Tulosesus angulatus]